jgi:hypothetical protein
VVEPGKTFKIPQALTLAQDSEHRHQEKIPSLDTHATAYAVIRDRFEEAVQIEIG